ncbi:MAG: glutamyl-tRNA reductase, partial [Verrucomicrobia bacterium RIFCSPLOWO2_12_FULL_64_8]
EAVILSTCNRVEFYVTTPQPVLAREALLTWVRAHSGLTEDTLRAVLYEQTDQAAVRHLFRVTAGLDSMVLGETEITAQVKQAYQAAHAAGTTGPVLNRLFQHALRAAKEVRSRTAIGQGRASVGSVVVSLAQEVFGDRFHESEVLLWGAGKAAETTARHLMDRGAGQLWIVNRTAERAQELATVCRAMWLAWEGALKRLARVDIAVICTQAPHYVIDRADVEAVWAARAEKPLFLIDLAVPRNVDPSLRGWRQVHLYDIDDLRTMAEQGLVRRRSELTACDAIIREQVDEFMAWWIPRLRRKEAVSCGGDPVHALRSLASL